MPELNWDGKFDEAGRKVAPSRIALPFQTVETVNESAQERQQTLDFFAAERPTEWRNRLMWGDKKYVLPSLLSEFSGAVDLIYIDPPFATGADFSLPIKLEASSFTKEPSVIEQKAYRDTWGVSNEDRRRGVTPYDRYVRWIYDTVTVLRDLLTEQGTIYVHIGPNVSHLVRSCLDEIFGVGNFRGEIIWKRTSAHSDVGQGARHLGRIHDSILLYTASDQFVWHQPHSEHSDKYVESHYSYVEPETGRRYRLDNLTGPGGAAKGNPSYEVMGVTRYWRYSKQKMQELIAAGRVIQTKPGAVPQYKRYLDESRGTAIGSIWTDINPINSQAIEDSGYPTQKPEALLQRILEMSSDPDQLVLDCFCGSGTTGVVAEKLRRRWIMCDLSRFGVHTARKRLLSIAEVRPFVVQNLGKYERQAWQTAEFGQSAAARTARYRSFILDLYHATPIAGYTWLHGLKQGRMVHVGTVDAPITVGDVKQIVAEFRKAVGTGKDAPTQQSVDILGWDFAFELNEIARQDAERAGIELRLVRIPREVLEKRAVEQGDIRFFELAALGVKVSQTARTVNMAIEDFVIPIDEVPADIQKAVTHWSQWIDYWAVDWDNKDDTFHNEWQTYRTRESKDLALSTSHEYEEPGEYRVVVKVIDILGNDTTKTLQLKVGTNATA
jgi:adenine-specific DNA-methyltransferase